jgi:hypothetical protein
MAVGTRMAFEYRSDRVVGDLPLVHVSVGGRNVDGRYQVGVARGIFAFGDLAFGLVAVGGIAFGLVSVGGIAFGLAAMAGVAVGFAALGGVAVGLVAVGVVAIGLASVGTVTPGAMAMMYRASKPRNGTTHRLEPDASAPNMTPRP